MLYGMYVYIVYVNVISRLLPPSFHLISQLHTIVSVLIFRLSKLGLATMSPFQRLGASEHGSWGGIEVELDK